MKYNFDEVINRRNTDSFKWDFNNDPEGTIPMPVADMDFACAPAIIEALREVTEQGVMGYATRPKELNEVFIARMEKLYNWNIKPEWLLWIPGLVPGLAATGKAVGEAGSGILTALPVYGPFHQTPTWVGKTLQTTQFVEKDGRWTIDFEALEAAITPDTRLFMLCNPHNPGGTVFKKEELQQLVDICQKHEIMICSDEIHCDLILDKTLVHIPTATISDWALENTITLMAPSKTFNIAGLGCSVAIIPNQNLRSKFEAAKAGFFPMLSRHSYRAALAAYRDCEDWRLELIDFLKMNHDFLYKELNGYKGLKILPLEATYLMWIDARGTGIENITMKLLQNGVRVLDGSIFKGEGFFRVNFACRRELLIEAIGRIKQIL